MGGRGSGRTCGWPTTLDDLHRVDLPYLRRHGCLRPGYDGTLRWSRAGHETGSIRFAVESDRLWLIYRVRRHGEEWEAVSESVPLVRTA